MVGLVVGQLVPARSPTPGAGGAAPGLDGPSVHRVGAVRSCSLGLTSRCALPAGAVRRRHSAAPASRPTTAASAAAVLAVHDGVERRADRGTGGRRRGTRVDRQLAADVLAAGRDQLRSSRPVPGDGCRRACRAATAPGWAAADRPRLSRFDARPRVCRLCVDRGIRLRIAVRLHLRLLVRAAGAVRVDGPAVQPGVRGERRRHGGAGTAERATGIPLCSASGSSSWGWLSRRWQQQSCSRW